MSAQTITPANAHEEPAHGPEAQEAELRGLRSVKNNTLRAAEELRAAAEQKAKDWARAADATADELRHKAEEALKSTQIRIKTLHDDSETYIRANPLKSVLAALGAGFLVGVLVRR